MLLRYITKTLHLKLTQDLTDTEIEIQLRADLDNGPYLDDELKNHIIKECLK